MKSYKGNSWGFPKGKIDRDEDKVSCAVREVLEEVGYDCSEKINAEDFLEMQWQQQARRGSRPALQNAAGAALPGPPLPSPTRPCAFR